VHIIDRQFQTIAHFWGLESGVVWSGTGRTFKAWSGMGAIFFEPGAGLDYYF